MERLAHLSLHLSGAKIVGKNADDIVICSAVRTPLTKAKKGDLKDTSPELLLSVVLRAAVERAKVNPKEIQDIVFGNNLQPGAGEIPGRMAEFLADFPDNVPIVAINRLCSSGLESCAMVASKIKAGMIDIGIGAGVESMSMYDMKSWVDKEKLNKAVFENKDARSCLMGMGETS